MRRGRSTRRGNIGRDRRWPKRRCRRRARRRRRVPVRSPHRSAACRSWIESWPWRRHCLKRRAPRSPVPRGRPPHPSPSPGGRGSRADEACSRCGPRLTGLTIAIDRRVSDLDRRHGSSNASVQGVGRWCGCGMARSGLNLAPSCQSSRPRRGCGFADEKDHEIFRRTESWIARSFGFLLVFLSAGVHIETVCKTRI